MRRVLGRIATGEEKKLYFHDWSSLLLQQQLDDDDGETGKCPRRFSTLKHGGFHLSDNKIFRGKNLKLPIAPTSFGEKLFQRKSTNREIRILKKFVKVKGVLHSLARM